MELKEFIRIAISQTLEGVTLAKEDVFKKYDAYLIDPLAGQHENSILGPHMIEIVASVTTEEGVKGKAGLNVMSMVTGGLEGDERTHKASSIRISIPITYPVYRHEN